MSARKKLCDVCHERPARYHSCNGSTGETKDLCMSCFEQTASAPELEAFRHSQEVIRNGRCKYCGEPAEGGFTSSGIPGGLPGVMEEKAELWCRACVRDLREFNGRPENKIPVDADEADWEGLLKQLADLERRKEKFMRQRVKERSKKKRM